MKFLQRWVWRLLSSGQEYHAVSYGTVFLIWNSLPIDYYYDDRGSRFFKKQWKLATKLHSIWPTPMNTVNIIFNSFINTMQSIYNTMYTDVHELHYLWIYDINSLQSTAWHNPPLVLKLIHVGYRQYVQANAYIFPEDIYKASKLCILHLQISKLIQSIVFKHTYFNTSAKFTIFASHLFFDTIYTSLYIT